MAKSADIGSKRLISLAPTAWAQQLTGDNTIEVVDLLAEEFQQVSRANDVLIKAYSATHGTFLIPNEIQLRPDPHIGRRLRAYTALAEERYHLSTYAVLALRADKAISELEPLLAFFASFVLQSETVRRIMRWEMAILRESPWYNEILVVLDANSLTAVLHHINTL